MTNVTRYTDHIPMLVLRIKRYTQALDRGKHALDKEPLVYKSLHLAQKHGVDVAMLCDLTSRLVTEPARGVCMEFAKEAMDGMDFIETYKKFWKSENENSET